MDRLFIIVGEPSGDLHAANLIKAIKQERPEIIIQAWGGDRMKQEGAEILKHIDELAFMGFVEVAANIRTILKNFKLCEKHIRSFNPDLVVFIDYPGFNLRMAKTVHSLGIKTAYYISPQIWAWKENRVKQIKALIDHVFVILPFERDFYKKRGVDAVYVGHPLLDEITNIEVEESEFRSGLGITNQKPIIALLPGSRTQEIQRLLKPIASLMGDLPQYEFVVSRVPWQPRSFYDGLPENAHLLEGNTYKLLKIAHAAVVTSGTATLETALIGTPQVVVYKANPLSVMIARLLVKVKYISLVNLVMDQPLIKELIQDEVNAKNILQELKNIADGGSRRNEILNGYASLKQKLGGKGASKFTASALLKIVDDQKKAG